MAFETTPNLEDLEYFYYMDYPQPIHTAEEAIEISPYCVAAFADISSTRCIYRCIGKKGNGLLAELCKATLSHDPLPTSTTISKHISKEVGVWAAAEYLVKLARSCLCDECCTTQLTDVVVAWVEELENPTERPVRRADSVIDAEKMVVSSKVVDIAPLKALVAASAATRDLVSKVLGFWS
jgi:hypothetical protein